MQTQLGLDHERCTNNSGDKILSLPNYDRRLPNYKFLQSRHLAFVRHRAQCVFRGEGFELSLEEWNKFWPDESRFAQRGRSIDDLVLTRYDVEKAWTRENCCIITRLAHLRIKNKRQYGKPYLHFFDGAFTIV